MKLSNLKNGLILAGLLSLGGGLMAQPVDVTYTVSGTSGDYTLDFTVQNNLNPGEDIYFFGVELSARNITGSPGSYDPNQWYTWNNSGYGGPDIDFNNNWIDLSYSNLLPGGSLSGFEVTVSDATAPTSIPWFLYAFEGDSWTDGGNFNTEYNPGFSGTAGASAPDTGSCLALLGGALGVMGAFARKLRK